MSDIRTKARSERGFSLLEMLMVVVVIGVLAAVVGPGLGSLEQQRQESAFDEVSRTFRYARATAMASGSPTGVRLQTGSGVQLSLLRVDPDSLNLEAAPAPLGEDSTTRYLDLEIPSLAISSMTNGDGASSSDETFWFRFDGTPHTRASDGTFTALFSESAEIVLVSGSGTRTIVIREHTGLIDEQ